MDVGFGFDGMYHREPSRVAVGIGAFGVAFTVLTTGLLVLVPQELMTPAASSAYIETWSGPVMAVGRGVLVYGLPLLSAAFAYVLTGRNHSATSVVTGFVVGGLVLGLGDALLGATVTHFFAEDPAIGQSLVGHLSDVVELGGRLVGGALLGTLSATVVRERV